MNFSKISETDNEALEPFLRVVGDEIFTNSKKIIQTIFENSLKFSFLKRFQLKRRTYS